MSYLGTKDFLVEVNKGNVAGHSLVHKFGRNIAVQTTFVPVSLGGIYPTPQPAGAVTLRVKAGGNAADTAAGAGAREVTLQGLDETGTLVTEAVATAGASASAATTTTFIRMFRAWVSASGTYATVLTGSHVGDIVIEDSGGVEDWLTIDSTDLSNSQGECGIYSLPAGHSAQILSIEIFSDSTKITHARLFRRESILDAAAPYQAARVLANMRTDVGRISLGPHSGIDDIIGPADIGIIARVTVGTAEVDCDFEILVMED